MKFSILNTRKGKLKAQLILELGLPKPDINYILKYIDEYEQKNLDTIKKLKRKKELDTRKINGALKQTINTHGPITKGLIGSATKRIYGNLLEPKQPNIITKILNLFK